MRDRVFYHRVIEVLYYRTLNGLAYKIVDWQRALGVVDIGLAGFGRRVLGREQLAAVLVFDNRDCVGTKTLRLRDNLGPLTVPLDGLFCLGDNRDDSKDSRFWGAVPRSAVRGRAVLIYWSAAPADGDGWWAALRGLFRRTRWSRCFQAVR